MDLVRCWSILEQFDKLVSENDFAARRRNGLADNEVLMLRLLAGGEQPHPVTPPVLPTEHKILAAALKSLLQNFGIGGGEIGGRQHVEELPDGEFDDRLVLRRHTAYAGGGIVPPLLFQKKRLGEQVERRNFPFRPGKARFKGVADFG